MRKFIFRFLFLFLSLSVTAQVNYYSLIGVMSKGTFDPDAQAFITAAGITDATQKTAINTLVLSLKSNSIWTKIVGFYPFVGGTATSHKYNLKDPRDLDAAFRLTFNGGWTHSSTGALPNGTTGWAQTYCNMRTNCTTAFIGYYSRSNTNTGTDQVDMGCETITNYPSYNVWVSAWYNGSGFSNVLGRDPSNSVLLNGGTTTDSRGFYWVNNVSSTAKLGKNTTILATASDAGLIADNYVAIGGRGVSNNTSADLFTNRECATAVIASGMSDSDVTNLYNAIQAFNTTLGRQI